MKKQLIGVLAAAFISVVCFAEELTVKYEDLKGPRRIDKEKNCWEIAFGGYENSEKIRSLPGLEGIIRIKEGKIEGLKEGEKIEFPNLNVSYDMRGYGKKFNSLISNSAQKINAKDGWNGGPLFNSREISGEDTDEWKANAITETLKAYPQGEYIIVPATWFDAKGKAVQQKNATLAVTYLDKENNRITYSTALDQSCINSDGSTRIGFFNIGVRLSWFTSQSCYIIQSDKEKGRVIGKISVDPLDNVPFTEKIAIIPGSIKIIDKKMEPFTKTDKIIHFLNAYHTMTDFDAVEISRLGNLSGLTPVKFYWFPLSLWPKYPEEAEKLKAIARDAQKGIDNLHKYGVKVILGTHCEGSFIHPEIAKKEFPDFIPEKLTKDGKFVKHQEWFGGLDEANPNAMKFLETEFGKVQKELFKNVDYVEAQPERRFFNPYNYLEVPFYSKAALGSFRNFVNNPNAKFPTAANIPETERTFNTPSSDDWKKYYEWRSKVHTDFFISWAKAGWNAFHDDKGYQGAMLVDSPAIALNDQPHGIELERLFASPYYKLFIAEYIKSSQDPVFKIWYDYAKKYKKQLINLFDDYQINNNVFFHEKGYMPGTEKNLVKLFISAGVECGTDGYSSCGLFVFNLLTYPSYIKDCKLKTPYKNIIWPLWRALVKKYYNYGDMPLPEAEQIIEKALKSAPVNFSTEGKRKAVIRMKNKIIDGNKEKWDFTSKEQVINKAEQAFLNPGKWKSPEDLSAAFDLAADDKNLYIGVDVKDDNFFPENKIVNGKYGDEANIFISFADPREDSLFMNVNCFQFRLMPGKDKVYIGETPLKGSKAIFKQTANGYFMEASIPFSEFKFVPQKGAMICFDFSILDADDESGVKNNLIWNAKYKPWNGPLKDNGWGIAVFE